MRRGVCLGNKPSRQHFRSLVDAFETEEALGAEPILLDTTSSQNAQAVAHAMRLASEDYPLAYGRGSRTFPIQRMRECFDRYSVFAVGKEHTLDGGAIFSHIDESQAEVDYLFRFRDSQYSVGRLLLACTLEHMYDNFDYESVHLEVVSRNTPARQLYEDVGFKENGRVIGNGHKLISMELDSRRAIVKAISKLRG